MVSWINLPQNHVNVFRLIWMMPLHSLVTLEMLSAHLLPLEKLTPQYFADDRQLTTTTGRQLASSNFAACEVPRTHTSLDNHSCTVAGPRLWINLPLHQRDSELTHLEFLWLLKTHLFCWGQRLLVIVCFWAPYKFAFTLHYIADRSSGHAAAVLWPLASCLIY